MYHYSFVLGQKPQSAIRNLLYNVLFDCHIEGGIKQHDYLPRPDFDVDSPNSILTGYAEI